MKTFTQWNSLFSDQKLDEFNTDHSGVVWLKLKSMFRKEILEQFLSKYDIRIPNDRKAFEALYNKAFDKNAKEEQLKY
jgi:hypothetical protein